MEVDNTLRETLTRSGAIRLDQPRGADCREQSAAAVGCIAFGSAPAAGAEGPGGGGSPFDPSQLISGLIQPVTDALGTLGSGQFGGLDPTQMLGGVSQALQSAGQSVQQAMGSLGGAWQGTAATAAAVSAPTSLSKPAAGVLAAGLPCQGQSPFSEALFEEGLVETSEVSDLANTQLRAGSVR